MSIIKSTRIDVYFNKVWIYTKDPKDTSWIVRVNGSTHYVHGIESSNASCRTVLAPDHKSTNAFLRFSGTVEFLLQDDQTIIAKIT